MMQEAVKTPKEIVVRPKQQQECIDGDETRLLVIQKLRGYDNPVSIYQVAKDLKMPLARVYPHIQKLVKEQVVFLVDYKKGAKQGSQRYVLNDCLKHLENHIECLEPLVQSLVEHNPGLKEDAITNILNYILGLMAFEVS